MVSQRVQSHVVSLLLNQDVNLLITVLALANHCPQLIPTQVFSLLFSLPAVSFHPPLPQPAPPWSGVGGTAPPQRDAP